MMIPDTIEIQHKTKNRDNADEPAELQDIALNTHTDYCQVNIVEDTANFKILTWNLWCMLFAPRTLSNPHRCGNYVSSLAKKEKWCDFDGLIICCFQEMWSWKTGLFPPFLLRWIAYFEYIPYLGILISFFFQFLSLLFGILPLFKCLPIKYNPKLIIASILRISVPYSYYNIDIPFQTFLDNGLLILSNQKADKSGCFAYRSHACDDSLANKGFLYVYFKKYHTLVLNTHLQFAGDGTARLAQIEELKQFINTFTKLCNENCNKKLKIIAAGDWNTDLTNHDGKCQCECNKSIQKQQNSYCQLSDCECILRGKSYADLPSLLGSDFVKMGECNIPTTSDLKLGSLDHIFVNFEFDTFVEEYLESDWKLSDHLLIKNDFTSDNTNISTHLSW